MPHPLACSIRLPAWLLIVLIAMLSSGCAKKHESLGNDAYVWQRQWTPALADALHASQDAVQTWRVLAAEVDVHGQWHTMRPDAAALAASGKPVIAVVRIEGQLDRWDEQALIDGVDGVVTEWRQRGLSPAGVEIDHDCATSRLPAYAHFLAALRPTLGTRVRLSITALPTWLDSTQLETLLAQVDEAVLQVHAVQSPRAGLFDPQRAHAWIAAFAKRVHSPWRVALPAYGTRVSWDDQGRVAAIESERPTLSGASDANELFADPVAMQGFLNTLQADAPPGLAGIVWFRLPTDDDTRAWSMATWRAVLLHQPLRISLLAQVRAARQASLRDLVLINAGNADVPLPSLVRLDAACSLADGANGYTLQRSDHGLFLQRARGGLLRAGRQLAIGWLRCDGTAALHIEAGRAR
ncbi:DUF3142 domain-containing protein [Dyella sp. ASV21]|uniref:DUF3142 domain-containing protein n=1 Tax=Dyella sp. ASV21 TaxID=2795114 RepID=UPI001E3B46EE|nr:DUF3142 domain-containing protein [Dyella sp. ASV21]